MNRRVVRSLWLALFAALIAAAPCLAQPDMRDARNGPGAEVSVSYFYDNLAASGQWVNNDTYGWCWTPYDMTADWRPYSDGHWEYTDYGWSWASNESWGWATYHYGRWFFDDTYGWVWVPGTEWAPAWVAWRYGDDYVGWAPLPPAAGWSFSGGLDFADANRIPSHEWCFVPRRHMLDANVRAQVTLVARNPTMIARSHDATRYETRNGRPADVGVDVNQARTFVGRDITPVRVVDVATPSRGGGRTTGGGVGFYRPTVRPSPAGQVPGPAARPVPQPTGFVQHEQATQQRRLESDLANEQRRLARGQQQELRARTPQPAAAALQQQHVAEQQAFQAHAAQQRQVLAQRMQRQVVRPAKSNGGGKPGAPEHGNGRDKGGR